jgi:hypothetical protein
MTRFRLPVLLVAALALAACETRTGLTPPPPAMQSLFKLGHVVVIADKATKAPISRDAKPEQWQAAIDKAVKDRFGKLDGNAFYHLGINVDGYALAPPGVPLLVTPKSVLIISVTMLTDTEGGKKLNEKPAQLTVFETLSGDSVVGTGLTKSAEEQMENLAFNAAIAIQDWLTQNPQYYDPTATAIVPIAAAKVN